MALATWWITDPMRMLSSLPGFHAGITSDNATLARSNRIPIAEVLALQREGQRP